MKISKELQVRFADIDVMGHVNNAIYLSYFEEGRMTYFEKRIGKEWDWTKDGIVLARNEVDYKIPILLKEKPIIDTYLLEIGKKSLTFAYSIHDGAGKEYAIGKSVLVCFDYELGKTKEVPDIWRELLHIDNFVLKT